MLPPPSPLGALVGSSEPVEPPVEPPSVLLPAVGELPALGWAASPVGLAPAVACAPSVDPDVGVAVGAFGVERPLLLLDDRDDLLLVGRQPVPDLARAAPR